MKKRILLPLAAIAFLSTNNFDAQIRFTTTPAVANCIPLDINNSGTLVGAIDTTIHFLWPKDGNFTTIGSTLSGDNHLNTRIGEDNTKVIGFMRNPTTNLNEFSIYDTITQTWSYLGGMGSMDNTSSSPYAVTSDNTTIVGLGWLPGGGAHAIKWTQGEGFQDLGAAFPSSYSRADAISDDKTLIGGYQDQPNGARTGAYWKDGVQTIIKDANNNFVGSVRAISYDGSKLVGNPLYGKYPYILDVTTGVVKYIANLQLLGDPMYKGSANGITNDGKTVIGYYNSTRPLTNINESFIWSEEMGYKDFTAYIKSLGIDVQDEYLYATAISPDGLKIGGYTKTKKVFVVDISSYLATNNSTKTNVKVYPNPATNVLNISGLKAETKINIYNVAGQLVKTSTSAQIDINNLPKGNYVVSYEVDGKTTSQKFIKQ
ncbi:Por secretion system C-terminal sorting domain-containing protein [Soonwooa buanensis]|uniref:Por secretion system C-terminal sorting domain-containing protein n=1 Tax=Soonwooa buanensis TaxID=619805 RepID=A0A1T5FPI8_9FLAO|nr:T9SS type A sorting domain-containing protein [Soonwooa buanensis]SKB98041.1 Por secretion system C-terminal sorting domain-containing protein [Soonwooa buanensis]